MNFLCSGAFTSYLPYMYLPIPNSQNLRLTNAMQCLSDILGLPCYKDDMNAIEFVEIGNRANGSLASLHRRHNHKPVIRNRLQAASDLEEEKKLHRWMGSSACVGRRRGNVTWFGSSRDWQDLLVFRLLP
jgi:hypothetical protein